MKQVFVAVLAMLCAATPLKSSDIAGYFDYYVLSLSWAPSWCRSVDDPHDSTSCQPGHRAGFVIHGLWPQYEQGWPQDCPTSHRNPSRTETRAMADLTGSAGLVWHQWRKHGRCSGLSAADYFATTRQAVESLQIPPVFSALQQEIRLPATVIEDAFIEKNPALSRNAITVTCQGPDLQEVRICLTRDLQPRDCAPDARRDCSRNMRMPPPR